MQEDDKAGKAIGKGDKRKGQGRFRKSIGEGRKGERKSRWHGKRTEEDRGMQVLKMEGR